MSLKQITLRPPPNVDFVHGYPGIPPGNNRPPAEVMGSVELRFPKDGLKAKWVKVVLRKIETLPGGINATLTPDFIGQMPQTIWAAQGEYENVMSKELPFRLRLPESIPPSLLLEKQAGIRYELVASVCVKGKKGLLRKSKSSVLEDMQVLQIDKHELHSTWPVYNQSDTRTETRDQLTLTVSRTQSCFSPGERVQVNATLHSNSFTASHLRAFDFSLVETIQFRPGPKIKPNKKSGPLFKSTRIGEHRIPVNATLYGGMHHSAELSCFVSPEHIVPTVNSARNLDVSYKIVVIAQVDNVKPYSVELPVSISNWQKMASTELTDKIGHVPNLSLGPPPAPPKNNQRLTPNDRTRRYDHLNHPQSQPLLNARVNPTGATINTTTNPASNSTLNEFGQAKPIKMQANTLPSMPSKQSFRDDNAVQIASNLKKEEKVRPSTASNTVSDSTGIVTGVDGHLTVANQHPNDKIDPDTGIRSWQTATEEKLRLRQMEAEKAKVAAVVTEPQSAPPRTQQWPSSDDEKRRMFQHAQSRVNRTQNQLTAELQYPDAVPSSAPSDAQTNPQWPSAEQEKRKLYENARRRAASIQSGEPYGGENQNSTPSRNQSFGSSNANRVGSPVPAVVAAQVPLTGAALYSSAMAAVNAARSAESGGSTPMPAKVGSPAPPASPATLAPAQGYSTPRPYPTAEEEKAALRYSEAKRAVEANQGIPMPSGSSSRMSGIDASNMILMHGAPIPYDQLFPENTPSLNGSAGTRDSYRTSSVAASSLSWSTSGDHDPRTASPAPSAQPPRRRPSLPTPPKPPGASRPLSAVEEKARLKAKYGAEGAGAIQEAGEPEASGSQPIRDSYPDIIADYARAPYNETSSLSRDPTIKQGKQRAVNNATPPPLLPKPPSNYIQETQAEDLRIRTQLDENDVMTFLHENERAQSPFKFSLDIRPFSPFEAGLNNITISDPDPVPPLPPKIPISH